MGSRRERTGRAGQVWPGLTSGGGEWPRTLSSALYMSRGLGRGAESLVWVLAEG